MINMTACQNTNKNQDENSTSQIVEENQEPKDVKQEEKKTEEKKEETKKTSQTKTTDTKSQTTKENESTQKTTQKKDNTEKKEQKEQTPKKKDTKKEEVIKKEEKKYCSITISCKNVLNNKDQLESNYQIPSNGIIYNKKLEIKDDDDVLSVLKRTGVRIDVQAGYVRGIDNLYEFDCGKNSGWMYKVNGVKPNVGASKYKVKKNDKIEWVYSCRFGDV